MARCLFVLLLLARTAAADEPWAAGVAQADQQRANQLFAEGNALFAQQAHAPALEKYRAAIALWDHPLIRFNMAVALIRLDRMLEAADAIASAKRFGPTPFKPEIYTQLLDYERVIQTRVGELEVSCTQDGAKIALDGKPWFSCPGTQKQRVLNGSHNVAGSHPAFLSKMIDVSVGAGTTTRVGVALVPLEQAIVEYRRYPRWVPWTVSGIGVTAMLVGFVALGDAANELEKYEETLVRECPEGCVLAVEHPELAAQRDAALAGGRLGNIVTLTGLVITSVGVVLFFMNTPQKRLPKVHVGPTSTTATWRF